MDTEIINPFEDAPPAGADKSEGRQHTTRKGTAKYTQAEKVIARFGGAMDIVRSLQRMKPEQPCTPSMVFRWTYPRTKAGGTDGLIPAKSLADVIDAARLEGILLTAEDLHPGRR